MGSVSDSVVRHAHCPVLVVRAEKGVRGYLEGSDSAARQPRREGAEEKRSFWDMLLGPYPSEHEEKVLEYIIHRLGDGADLEDIVQEQYVRRKPLQKRSRTSWITPDWSRVPERSWKRILKS